MNILDPVLGYSAGLYTGRLQCTSNCKPNDGYYFDARFSLDLRKMTWGKAKKLQIHAKSKRAANGQYGNIFNNFSEASLRISGKNTKR